MKPSTEDIIYSKDNPNIKLFRKLSSSKKERKKFGLFVLEGLRLVSDAINENAPITMVMLTETAYYKQWEMLGFLDKGEFDCVIISDDLGLKISSTEQTQGVFAICKALDKLDLSSKINKCSKFIVLHQLQDPGNVGMIIRTADAMGMSGVILSESCDLFNPKTVRSTMGSLFRVPLIWDAGITDVIDFFKSSDVPVYASVIDSDAGDIRDIDKDNGCAVLIGNEGNGLPRDITEYCTGKVTIKMKGHINSLNASMASGIIMWEMCL